MKAAWVSALVLVVLAATGAPAQKKSKDQMSGYDRSARATMIHPAIVYLTANDDAGHITEVGPGHEVVVIERNGVWVVEAHS